MSIVSMGAPDLVALAREVVDKGGRLRFVARGHSMAPTIRHGSTVVLHPLPSSVCHGHAVLARTDDGPVLHRVIGVRGEGRAREYRLRGDAQSGPGEWVGGGDLIGSVPDAAVSAEGLLRLRLRVAARLARRLVAVCLLMATACQKPGQVDPPATAAGDEQGKHTASDEGAKMKITSSVFQHEGEIPSKYTCEGDDVSVPLAWSDVPAEARSLALIVDDPDAPDPKAPKMVWVHWVLYNLPTSGVGLEEAVRNLPEGTGEGINDWKRTGYGGPCPPIGRHRYFHKLYALDSLLPDLGNPTRDELMKAMEGHIVSEAVLMGTYQKVR